MGLFDGWTCLPGDEISLGSWCFPKCKNGYTGSSFFCTSPCDLVIDSNNPGDPNDPNLISSGDDWNQFALLCWKRLYDRGGGNYVDACSDPSNQLLTGICYPECAPGYVSTLWSPRTCTQPCPPNTAEGGFANCTKTGNYGRGGGNKGLGCNAGYSDMLFFCFNWSTFDTQNYICPSTCSFVPSNGTIGYGRSGECVGVPTASEILAGGQLMYTDSRGAIVSGNGCYVDPDDNNSWLPISEPMYYLGGKYPGWYEPPSLRNTFIPLPSTINDVNYNSRRSQQIDQNCEENWGTLCYPRCDIGYDSYACCICNASCGNLRDDGPATCHRDWQDRGIGKIPNSCSDPEKVFEDGMCYTRCKDGYQHFATTCTKQGCPYDAFDETALSCTKKITTRGTGYPLFPPVGDKINGKINIGPLVSSAKKIAVNIALIGVIILIAVIILSVNLLFRSKGKKLKHYKI